MMTPELRTLLIFHTPDGSVVPELCEFHAEGYDQIFDTIISNLPDGAPRSIQTYIDPPTVDRDYYTMRVYEPGHTRLGLKEPIYVSKVYVHSVVESHGMDFKLIAV